MSLANRLSTGSQTFRISSNNAANNLSQQAARLERDQLVSQYTNQLRELSRQYEQSQIQQEQLKLQNVQQQAATMNDVMGQRFNANNQYLQAIQAVLSNQVQNANENTQTLQSVSQQSETTQREVKRALDKNVDAKPTRRSTAETQNLVDNLVSEVQAQQTQGNNARRDIAANTEYVNTTGNLLSQIAASQRNATNSAANITSQMGTLSANQNAANLARQDTLNRNAFNDTTNQINQTIQQARSKYLADLQNLSQLRIPNIRVSNAGASSPTMTNNSNTLMSTPQSVAPTSGRQSMDTGYFVNGREVSAQEYRQPRRGM